MVTRSLSFQRHLVGPYGLFSDQNGCFIVGREVKASSQSSEVLKLLSSAPRFSSIVEPYGSGVDFVAKEYAEIESIDFDYGHLDSKTMCPDHLTVAAGIFNTLMLVFGGWREFYRDVVRNGGGMDLAWDEDGIDYERIIDFTVRLRMTGGIAERLIKTEGYNLW